jgi:hypothetical protein
MQHNQHWLVHELDIGFFTTCHDRCLVCLSNIIIILDVRFTFLKLIDRSFNLIGLMILNCTTLPVTRLMRTASTLVVKLREGAVKCILTGLPSRYFISQTRGTSMSNMQSCNHFNIDIHVATLILFITS